MKHKNGQIKNLGSDEWYVSFGNGHYLKKDGEAFLWENSVHGTKTHPLIMHETREQAQATLDKYNKQEPTISEVKQKLSAAKKLIGKKIKVLKGHLAGRIGEVLSVKLVFCEDDIGNGYYFGPLGSAFFKDNEYAIYLNVGQFNCLYDEGVFEVIPSISVKNHSGEEYSAEQYDKYWQFGYAKISKKMIKDSLNLIDTHYADGNREISKVTIGAADFDFDTLKKLVDADDNKG